MNNQRALTGLIVAFVVSAGCATTDEQAIVSFAPVSVATANAQIVDDLTPLHRAAHDGDGETVNKLLQQGKNPNAASTSSGVTPLILAATMGHEPIVAALLAAGAAVDAADQAGGTSLMYASSKGHVGIVALLLQRDANVNVISPKDGLDSTALTLAAGNGQDAVLALLLKAGAEIDWRTERDGLSALLLAAELGHAGSVRLLLAAGANPALADPDGKTACDLAAANRHVAVTQVLNEFYQMHNSGMHCRPTP